MSDSELSMRDRVAMLRLPQLGATNNANNRAPWLPWTLVLLLAGCTLSLFVRGGSAPATVAPLPSNVSSPTVSTSTTPANSSANLATVAPGAVALESKGYIIAAHQIQVSPIEVSGRIIELFIEEGKRFNAGDPLAILDSSSFLADYEEARAAADQAAAKLAELNNGLRPEEIDQVYAELKEAQEALKQMKLEYDRNKNLTGGALSAQEFEKAQYAYTAQNQRVKRLEKTLELAKLGPRKERIDLAAAEFKTAEARVRRAKWRLDNCIIRAPVSGTILKKSAEIGNLVSPLSFNVSASICEMADLSDLEVDLEIPERDISKVIVGMTCKVTTDAYPNRLYDGRVDRLMPIALQNKAAIQVRVKLSVPKEEVGTFLKPGMNARVTFLQPEPAKAPPKS